MPWSNEFPAFHFGFTTYLFVSSVLALLLAAWFHFAATPELDEGGRWSRISQVPLTIAVWRW